jgi:hypothetical protein
MSIELNHTIVYARDKQVSAAFLADILGLSTSPPVARFRPVALDNGVTATGPARSTTTGRAGEACTSPTPTDTTWNC